MEIIISTAQRKWERVREQVSNGKRHEIKLNQINCCSQMRWSNVRSLVWTIQLKHEVGNLQQAAQYTQYTFGTLTHIRFVDECSSKKKWLKFNCFHVCDLSSLWVQHVHCFFLSPNVLDGSRTNDTIRYTAVRRIANLNRTDL